MAGLETEKEGVTDSLEGCPFASLRGQPREAIRSQGQDPVETGWSCCRGLGPFDGCGGAILPVAPAACRSS